MRILIADDEPRAPETYARLLDFLASQNGIEVTCVTANDGLEALERINETSFDAVLCDLEMPGASGLTIAEAFRRKENAKRFVLFTGKLLTQEEEEKIRELNVTFLAKPFSDIHDLEVVIK